MSGKVERLQDESNQPTLATPQLLQRQLRDMLTEVADVLESGSVRYWLCAGTALGAYRSGDLIPWDFDIDLLVDLSDYGRALDSLRQQLPARYRIEEPTRNPEYEHLFARVHLRDVNHKYAHVDLFPLGGTFGSRRAQHAHLTASQWLRRAYYVRGRLAEPSTEYHASMLLRTVLRHLARRVPRGPFIYAFGKLCALKNPERSAFLVNLAAGYLEREAMPRSMFMGHQDYTIGKRAYPCPTPTEEYLGRVYGNFRKPPPTSEQEARMAFFDEWYRPALERVHLDVDK